MGYIPVYGADLAGVQMEDVLYARVNLSPSEASLSRLGVIAMALPEHPITSSRCWSGWMIRIFGFSCSFVSWQEADPRMNGEGA